jgi:FkbM family methyltransferase
MLGRPVIMPFVGDAVLVVEAGMTGATGNIYCGLHEFTDMALALHFLRPTDLFLDVGANVGSYTILSAKVVGSQCLAVEPVPETVDRLRRNIALNGLNGRVEVLQCAVGASKGQVRFAADNDTTNCTVGEDYPGRSITVPACTIDEILVGKNAVMWKVDVEGAEREVLRGAPRSLQSGELNVVLLESDDSDLTQIMLAAGFMRHQYDPFRRRLDPIRGAAKGQNNLWVKNRSAVEARCRTAPKRVILGTEI